MDRQRVVIAGGTGMLGQACAEQLSQSGYEVCILTRSPRAANHIRWNPAEGQIDDNVVDGAYAVINLTGTPLDGARWTSSYKKILKDSRIVPAQYLTRLIDDSTQKPKVYLGASAIGIYGDSGDSPVQEDFDAAEQDHFVVQLGQAWEAAHPRYADGRTVILRISVVLAKEGGFLPRVLAPAKLGAYGYIGSGRQMMSWVHLEDLVRSIQHCLESDVTGTFNVSAGAMSSRDVMRVLRSVRNVPGLIAGMPSIVAAVVLGEMTELLEWSCNASSGKLTGSGFSFKYPELKRAFEDLLK